LIKLGDPELNSENSFTKDFGIKYLTDKISLGGNLFHNKMTNLVIETAGTYNGTDALIKTNAGEAVLYGYELFGTIDLPYNFSISGNLAYVYAEDVNQDQPLASIPPLNGQLFLNHRWANYLNFTFEMNAFARQDRIADWELKTPGYTYFNLYVYSNKFQLMSTTNQLFFRIDNITDKEYRNHLSTNRGTMMAEPGRNFSINWQIGL
jgi:outer membrane receptor protein involved in Fe transport